MMRLIIIRKKFFFHVCVAFTFLLIATSIFRIMAASRAVSQECKIESDYLIQIYLEEKRLYLYKDNRRIKDYAIASGKTGWPSPIGEWTIVEKGVWGEGFGGYWLGLNVLWGRYGIHGTFHESSIGNAASHGCIRMYNHDVEELYDQVPIGTPVIINGGPYGPFGTGFRPLIPGDRGADVLEVQKKLRNLGYFQGNLTGIYGDDLKSALYRFQKENQLKIKYTIADEDYIAMGFREFE